MKILMFGGDHGPIKVHVDENKIQSLNDALSSIKRVLERVEFRCVFEVDDNLVRDIYMNFAPFSEDLAQEELGAYIIFEENCSRKVEKVFRNIRDEKICLNEAFDVMHVTLIELFLKGLWDNAYLKHLIINGVGCKMYLALFYRVISKTGLPELLKRSSISKVTFNRFVFYEDIKILAEIINRVPKDVLCYFPRINFIFEIDCIDINDDERPEGYCEIFKGLLMLMKKHKNLKIIRVGLSEVYHDYAGLGRPVITEPRIKPLCFLRYIFEILCLEQFRH